MSHGDKAPGVSCLKTVETVEHFHSSSDHGCDLVKKFYAKESYLETVLRYGTRAMKCTKRSFCRILPLLLGLLLALVCISSISWISQEVPDAEIYGLSLSKVGKQMSEKGASLEAILAAKLPVGYNKKTFVYLNGVRVPCIWDTGAFRACMAKRFGEIARDDQAARKSIHPNG